MQAKLSPQPKHTKEKMKQSFMVRVSPCHRFCIFKNQRVFVCTYTSIDYINQKTLINSILIKEIAFQ